MLHHFPTVSSAVCAVFLSVCVPCAYTHAASAPVLKTKTLFLIEGDFRQPSDVVAGTNGRVYVLDGVNNRVTVHGGGGSYLFSFGTTGAGNGEFHFPLGIGIDDANRIYVADSGNHRVQIFSPDGAYLSHFITGGDPAQGKPSDPTDVAVNALLKRCYVVDNDHHCVIIFDLETMKPLKREGIMGMEKKEFRFPFMLDLDSAGNVYIVEVINTRVKVLDPEGNYLTTIGTWGVEHGRFYRPKGVTVDSGNRVFVSDSYLGVIQVFDSQGRFLAILGDENGAVRKFNTPTGMHIDRQMRLYVTEMLANRVSVVQLEEIGSP